MKSNYYRHIAWKAIFVNYLRLYSRNQSELGATFLIALVLGCLVIGGGLLALTQANTNKLNIISDVKGQQATGIAEGIIDRYIDFLTKYPEVAVYCAVPNATIPACNTGKSWSNITISDLSTSCASHPTNADVTVIQNYSSSNWQNFASPSQYRLVSYVYSDPSNSIPGKGILTIDSKTANNTNSAFTRLQVEIPINTGSVDCPIPGIWAKSSGVVKVSPHFNGSINAIVVKTGSPPSSTNFPSGSLTLSPNDTIYDGKAVSVSQTPKNQPAIPNSVTDYLFSSSQHIFSVGNQTDGYLDLSGCTIRLPRRVGSNAFGMGCPSQINSSFNSVTTADIPDADGRYYYKIPSDGNNPDTDSIKLSNAAILIEPPNVHEKVVLYVVGKITMTGTNDNGSGIVLPTSSSRDTNPKDQNGLGCELTSDLGTAAISTFINQGSAENLEIYGTTNQQVNLSSNTRINGFMLFPDGEILVSQGLISGAVWAKTFDFTNTSGCTVGMQQNSVGNILAAISDTVPQIQPISAWQRLTN